MLFAAAAFSFVAGKAQLVIEAGSTVFLEPGAKLVVQGNLTAGSAIQGTGTVVMKGAAAQTISMNGYSIPNLEIDNPANVSLDGSGVRIGTNLLFTNGKLLTAAQDLVLEPTATITGHSAARFIWTNGPGQVKKELTGDVADLEIPIGENTAYRPVYLTTAGGTYAAGATIGVRNASGVSANRPPSLASYIASHWTVSKEGITGGTQTAAAKYLDTDLNSGGTEANLRGYYFNGTDWTSVNGTNDGATNLISARLSTGSGEITAMNKFIAAGVRAYLQGPYNTSGLMNDNLRTGTPLIPLNDPYRNNTDYSGNFVHHASNTLNETIAPSVLADQTAITSNANNIVDWVFLELRSSTTPFSVQQTRAALIQRDGDIVDVDGYSPVTFNNVPDGSFMVAVRHRNHIGIVTTSASLPSFGERRSLAFTDNVLDMRIANLSGASPANFATASNTLLGQTVKLMYAGNANTTNPLLNYSGSNNDRAFILANDLGGSQLATPTGYRRGDINMNRTVSYSGSQNDRAALLSALNGNQLTSRSQANPN